MLVIWASMAVELDHVELSGLWIYADTHCVWDQDRYGSKFSLLFVFDILELLYVGLCEDVK